MRQRYDGYVEALNDARIQLDLGIVANQHTPHKYYKRIEVEKAIEEFTYIPDGIVCANDDIAMDAIRFLKTKGLKVPEDVMITGFDN